jgi:cytochrome P450
MTTQTKGKRLEVPGPVERSLLGSLTAFRRNPSSTVVHYWQKYGDFFKMRLGPHWIYVANHPDYVKYVMVDNHKNYTRGKFFKNFRRIIGRGLVGLDGKEWQKHRKIMQPTFKPQTVPQYADIVVEGAANMLARWDGYAKQNQIFDAAFEVFELVLTTFGHAIFKMDLSEYADEFIPGAHEGLIQMIQNVLLPEWMPTAKNRELKSIRKLLDSIVARVVDEYRRGLHGGEGVVNALLRAEAQGLITAEEVHYEVLTLLVVGTDTTTSALSWALYILATHPDVRQKLEEEAERVLNGRTPTVDDLPALDYTRRMLKEVLRMYPPVWLLSRDPIEDDQLGGYVVPKGSTVMLFPYLIHRHPDFWEHPEAFDPDRFLPEKEETRNRYSYMPFGAGHHQCIGMHSAFQQLHLTLPMIVQKFRVELTPSGTMIPSPGLTMHPGHGLRVRLHPRG